MSEPSSDSPPEAGEGEAGAPPIADGSPRAEALRATAFGVLSLLLIAASLLAPLAAVGVWDPHELSVADLARRFALNFFPGAGGLALEGADNAMPTRGELSRGELPITSIALGFRLFGLYEWAGRLPLAVWGLGGAAATYWLVARLADRTAAALTVVVLATTPLYFLQARTMLGDIVMMAAFAGACAGLGVAVFDRGAPALQRWCGVLLGAAALAAGFLTRGLLLGVAVPALAVGLSWLLFRAGGRRARERFGDVAGAGSLLVGSAAAAAGALELSAQLAEPSKYFWWLGFGVEQARKLPTFDSVLLQLGHALFPWSAVLPVAAARLLAPTANGSEPDDRALALRTLLLVTPAVAYFGHALLAPVAGVLPFSGVGPLAAAIAVGLLALDRGAPASRVAGMLSGALAIVFLVDFQNFPEKALSGFALSDVELPDSFRAAGTRLLAAGTLIFAGVFFLSSAEVEGARRRAFERTDYAAWLKTVRELWNGNLAFGLLAVEAALIGFVAIDWLGERVPALREYVVLGGLSRSAASVGWLVPPALVVLPLAVMAARDVFRFYDGLRVRRPILPSRGALSLLSVAAFGLVLSLVYFPTFGAHVSPQHAFSAYRRLAASADPIALLGANAGAATYYAGRSVPTFASAAEAFDWLTMGTERRWLVIKGDDLATLNAQFREHAKPARNLPVLDATSSEVLLVSNRLEPGESNQNPLSTSLLERAPAPVRRVDANLGEQLDVLGWEVTHEGRSVDAVVPGRRYEFTIYYKVVGDVSGSWETFIHIDGFQRRFNGDHPTFGGKLPWHLLAPGDYAADRYEFALEPNFTPGTYRVYFGLFTGSRRMEVTRGRHDDDRVDAGPLRVE